MPGGAHERRRRRQRFGPEERRRFVLSALERPRTQSELRDALGMSNSGILHLLRRLERDGLVRPAERVAWTRIWERTRNGG
ncbi:winged helix-turn-helix transcriptional regulator [Salipiger thiooxidans]|uniref:winged helix-turn-helix transcriptional regulator n=1 Tax=Salipiger thiooxidans TaxID=282683 RepID=UPI001A8EB9A7|nr:winged helix-turn-helix transcriptional regulator [Salipiger thiooxidans]